MSRRIPVTKSICSYFSIHALVLYLFGISQVDSLRLSQAIETLRQKSVLGSWCIAVTDLTTCFGEDCGGI